jgi:hypothetical protein
MPDLDTADVAVHGVGKLSEGPPIHHGVDEVREWRGIVRTECASEQGSCCVVYARLFCSTPIRPSPFLFPSDLASGMFL